MGEVIGKRIIWAVDAFEDRSGPQRHCAEILQQLRPLWHPTVVPVHVLSPAELNLSPEFMGPWAVRYLPVAESAMSRLLSDLGIEDAERPRILQQESASLSRAADVLSDFALKSGADAILVGSHGRTGISRLLIGSFAETMLQRSQVPVIVAGERATAAKDFKRVLAALDFGDQCRDLFKHAIEFARSLGASMTLYHAVPRPGATVYESGVYMMGSPWLPVTAYYNRALSRARRRLDTWARCARKNGVACDTVLDTETHSVSDSILTTAHGLGVGWILMGSQTGPIASALLGSVARRVVRGAECPVWIYKKVRGKAAEKPRKAAA